MARDRWRCHNNRRRSAARLGLCDEGSEQWLELTLGEFFAVTSR